MKKTQLWRLQGLLAMKPAVSGLALDYRRGKGYMLYAGGVPQKTFKTASDCEAWIRSARP